MTRITLSDIDHQRPTALHRHPVAMFFGLTLGVAWALWLPLVILQDRMPPAPALLLAMLGHSCRPPRPSSWSRGSKAAARFSGCCGGS